MIPASTPVKGGNEEGEAWQLKLFRRSLKKQQKLAALLAMVGDLNGRSCLLVTCGDNNGALNWHFRRRGGQWCWADMEADSIRQIGALTGDPVLKINKAAPALPLPDGQFDLVLTIDVHEHLHQPDLLNRELARVTRSGGRVVVTTPGGDPRQLANRIKRWLGMHTDAYGHVVDGYSHAQLADQLSAAGLSPAANSSYSHFFTELLELTINFAYVKILARRRGARVEQGQIAPQNEDQLRSVQKSYQIYSLAYPFLWMVSRLDFLLPFKRGYAVIVAARKE